MAKKALKYLNPQRVTDFPPSSVADFDGEATQLIDVALIINLKIDGRELVNVPFLVNNMKHDLILGRKWFKDHGVVIDCREKQFLYREWPTITASEDIPMDEKGYETRNPEDNDIEPTKCDAKTQLQRNRALLHKQNSKALLRRSKRILNRKKIARRKKDLDQVTKSVDIQVVGSVASLKSIKKEKPPVKITYLREIDGLINERQFEKKKSHQNTTISHEALASLVLIDFLNIATSTIVLI
ncbi:hypothetical protein GcM1_184021 [Golovinomyces cichoracearum]|uniref:Uncharacterized protein n=1 Tax=Golovinomyces cichoracearum TaxID=62708 RepID=A0A420J3J9_9PEZI|nr:hypothetical protein GcM1_184021 [Golovinomyces cichoracearum]